MSICTRIVVAVPLQKIDNSPDTKSGSKSDNKGLQYVYCAVEKFHIVLTFCRYAAVKIVWFCFGYEKSRPLSGGCPRAA